MKNTAEEKLAKDLLHRYNLAIEAVRQIVLPEESRDRRLYYLESIEKENETNNEPRFKKYM